MPVKTLLAALVAALLSLAAVAESWTNLQGTVDVPEGTSLDTVEQAIVKSAIGRRWTIKEAGDGLVVINLVHRGYDATLNIVFDEAAIRIYSDSWAIRGNGERKKRKDPDGWIDNMEKDISVNLARLRYAE